MSGPVFTNNASSRIVVALAAVDTAVRVTAGEGARFPSPTGGNWFMLTLEDRRSGQIEITKCTARSVDILTIVRAQEGTAAQAFEIGATASNRLTAGTIFDSYSWSYSKAETDDRYVNTTGDTMTGVLVHPAPPTLPEHTANKEYVDQRVDDIPLRIAARIKSLAYMVTVDTDHINTLTTSDLYGQTYLMGADEGIDVYINGLREFEQSGGYGGYTINSGASTITFVNPILAGSSVVIDAFSSISAEPVVSVYKLGPIAPDGTTTIFTMAVAGTGSPVDALSSAEVSIHVNNVPQQPDVDFTALGATLTFNEAPEADADVWGVWVRTEN